MGLPCYLPDGQPLPFVGGNTGCEFVERYAEEPVSAEVGKVGGFSLHAGVAAGRQSARSYRDCVSTSVGLRYRQIRLSLTENGDVYYELKS